MNESTQSIKNPLITDIEASHTVTESRSIPSVNDYLKRISPKVQDYIKTKELELKECEKKIAENPNDTNAYNLKGNILNSLNRKGEASAAYIEVISRDPTFIEAYLSDLKIFNTFEPTRPEVIQACDKAIEANPNNISYYVFKAELLYKCFILTSSSFGLNKMVKSDDSRKSFYSPYSELSADIIKKAKSINAISIDSYLILIHHLLYNTTLDSEEDSEAIKKSLGEKCIETHPNNPMAYLVKVFSSWKDPSQQEELLEMCDKAISMAPNTINGYLAKVSFLIRLGRKEEAFSVLDTAIAIDPNNSEIYNQKGLLLKHSRMYQEALEMFDKAIAINLNSSELYLFKADLLFEMNQKFDALHLCQMAIEFDPSNIDLYLLRGNLLSRLGMHEEALKTFDYAMLIDPTSILPYREKTVALININKKEEAAQLYAKVLTESSFNIFTFLNGKDKLSKLIQYKDYSRHYDLLNRWIQCSSTFGYALSSMNIGDALVRLKDQGAIMPYYNVMTIMTDGFCCEILPIMANLSITANDFFSSFHVYCSEIIIKVCDHIISQEPGNIIAYENKAIILNFLKKKEEALEAYSTAISLGSLKADIYDQQGVLLEEFGKIEEALEAYNKAILIDPNQAFYYYHKAKLLITMNKNEEALAIIDKGLTIDSHDSDLLAERSKVLWKMGHYPSSVKEKTKGIFTKMNLFLKNSINKLDL